MISDYLQRGTGPGEAAGEGMTPTYDMWGTVLAPSDGTAKGSVRVRVKSMKDGEDIFDDVPVLAAYGGGSHGLFFMPEEGDTVRLTFVCGDFRHPVVTGCRFPAGGKYVEDMYGRENLKKGWKMKGGSGMVFEGEEGKEKIRIAGPGKMEIGLDEGEERICFGDMQHKNSISVDRKEGRAAVSAEEEILLKCGKSSLSLKKDGTFSIRCENLSIEAGNVDVRGKRRLQMKGQDLKVEASTGITVSSKTQMKLECKGQMKLSGGMIHLN